MTQISPQAERLLFLAKVINREIKHLKTTDYKLRNQMVHEYIEAPEILVDAINYGHDRVEDLMYAANQMLIEIERRIVN